MTRPLRIAVACAGHPTDPRSFSGIPSSLLGALAGLGVEGVPITAEAPGRLHPAIGRVIELGDLRPRGRPGPPRSYRRRDSATASSTLAMARVRSAAAAIALRRAGAVDGAVQYGTEYNLPRALRVVTYEDSTVRAAQRTYDWPWMRDMSPEAVDRWAAHASAGYARARACCFTSHWAARSAVEDHRADPGKVRVVGIGHNHAPPAPADRDWRVPRFLFVGWDWERKNGDRLVRVFGRLREELPEATLDVVGGHPALAAPGVHGHGRLSLADPGARERVEALYARATCLVLPSLHEPSAVAHVEAAAAGVASIGSTVGGVATLIGDAGRLVDPHDETALLAAMRELADPETAAALGARALARAPLFTWRAVAERLLDALGLRPSTVPPLERG